VNCPLISVRKAVYFAVFGPLSVMVSGVGFLQAKGTPHV
jgi:hypothetical protein